MSQSIAFFLGAGASAPFGFPLTKDILPKVREEISSGVLFDGFPEASKRATQLGESLQALLPGFNSVSELPSITEILSLVDYSLLTTTSPVKLQTSAEVQNLRTLLEQAIYDVLWWPYEHDNPPPLLIRWTEALSKLAEIPSTPPGIISTNYDLSLETELARRWGYDPGLFDFGFAWRSPKSGIIQERPASPRLRLYKLHGSVSWLRCDLCDHIYINLRGAIGGYGYSGKQSGNTTCHCEHSPLRPVLIAPSLVRDVREVNLLEIWKHSLELLREAEEWVLIGYSFPPEDITVRSLILRAAQGRRVPPRVTVVQKGDDPHTRARYEVFFPGCDYLTQGLEEYVDVLEKSL
jgi:hypothetical protein